LASLVLGLVRVKDISFVRLLFGIFLLFFLGFADNKI
jgi:hypothetical protein